MSAKRLSAFTAGIPVAARSGVEDPEILGLAYDSRRVGSGFLFFALEGLHVDGHRFVDEAVERGARAVVHTRALERYREGVVYLRVADAQTAMSPLAAAYYDFPSKELAVVGVTGTEGKTTTVFLVYQLLDLSGHRAGFLSTVMSRTGSEEAPNPEHQTTPEAIEIQRLLALMRDNGMEYAVVESSSHGLSARTGRLLDVAYDVGVLTNVTHEHLEFHGTWERYRDDKANLFRALGRSTEPGAKRVGRPGREVSCFGVVNADDPSAAYFSRSTSKPVYSYSAEGSEADVRALDVRSDAAGSSFTLLDGAERGQARINLPGRFNVGNCLAALLAVSRLTGRPAGELVPLLPLLRPVPGRMASVDVGQPFDVIVDYAHTPSSFEAVFRSVRAREGKRLIAVFGSAGERDVAKRALQGEVASRFCDVIILADEDPRGEEPLGILEEIASGVGPAKRRDGALFLIPDRMEAIRKAVSEAHPGDTVLLLGKGHETTIIYRDRVRAWDERAAAERALGELGFAKR